MPASKSAADKAPPMCEALALPVMRTQCCRIRLASSERLTWIPSLIRGLPSTVYQKLEELLVVHAAHNGIEKQRCRSAISDPMIKGETEHASMTDSQLGVAHHRPLNDSTDPEDDGL